MSGYGVEELLGMRLFDLVAAQSADVTAARMQKIIANGDDRFESRHGRKDGSIFDVEVSVQYQPAQGGRFVVFSRDITERKRLEAEREQLEEQLKTSQKMEAIGRLAGGVAHDFNNLLSVILLYTGFAMEGADDSVKDDIIEVKKAAERGVALVRQLLAFSRKQVLQPVPLDLNKVVTGFETMLRRVLGEDIDLVQVLAPDLGLTWPTRVRSSRCS